MRFSLFLSLLFVVVAVGCDSRTPSSGQASMPAGHPEGSICLGMTCNNADGNSHTECGCGADYCVPNERTVEFAGLTPLTCTQRDCNLSDPSTCPEGYECLEIPGFALEWLETEKGIQMPTYLCTPTVSEGDEGLGAVTEHQEWVALDAGILAMCWLG